MKKLSLAASTVVIATLLLSSAARAQEPANPVSFTILCSIPAGQQTCNTQVSLPAGKRIVVEHVSAKASAPSGQPIQLYLSTSSPNLPNGTTTARNFVVLTPTSSGTAYFANHMVRMYGGTSAYVAAHGQRTGTTGSVQYEIWVTGYLLP